MTTPSCSFSLVFYALLYCLMIDDYCASIIVEGEDPTERHRIRTENLICAPAPPSNICLFPTSGNFIYYIPTNYSTYTSNPQQNTTQISQDACRLFNAPASKDLLASTKEIGTKCSIKTEACMRIITEFFCSSLCPRCTDDPSAPVLLPCEDLCTNYTKCKEDLPPGCLPDVEVVGGCAWGVQSWEKDSYRRCTFLSGSLNQIPHERREKAGWLGTQSSASSLSSFFFTYLKMVLLFINSSKSIIE
jgi:hypothetical protein